MMSVIDEVINVVGDTLGVSGLDKHAQLLGSIPEFDSMAVVGVLTALEEFYGFEVDDDEIDGEIFETISSLAQFVEKKMSE